VNDLAVCAHYAFGLISKMNNFLSHHFLLLFVQKTDNKTNTKNISNLFIFENNFRAELND